MAWLRVACATLFACGVSAPPTPGVQASAPWPVVRHDDGLTGQSAVTGARTGAVKWRFDTGARIGTASPVIDADGTIYVGNTAGSFVAVRADGSLKWRAELGFAVEAAAAIAYDGVVYVGSNDGRIHVFDPTGHEVATTQTLDSIRTSLVVDSNGVAYFETDQKQCTASRGGGATCTFLLTQLGAASATVAFANGTMYSPVASYPYGSIGGTREDGTSINLGTGWLGAVSSDGMAYVVSPSLVTATNASGTQVWSASVSTPTNFLYSDVVLALRDAHSVYLRFPQGVAAVGSSGVAWSVDVGAAVAGALAVDATGAVYFGAADGALHAFDHDGASIFTATTGGEVRSSPAIGGDGTVYVGSDDGLLYAVGP